MPPMRIRFTIRSLILAVALVALNFAGAMGTPKEDWGGVGLHDTGSLPFQHLDRRVEYGVGCRYGGPITQTNGKIGGGLEQVWRLPLPPTLLKYWFSVIASASITLLILTACSWNWVAVPGGAPPDAAVGRCSLLPRLWLMARWMMVATALIALNVASAVYQPRFDLYQPDAASRPDAARADAAARRPHKFVLSLAGDPGASPRRATARPVSPWVDLQVECRDLFDGVPRVLNVAIDGTTVERCAMEVEGATQDRLPEVIFQDSPIGEATIDFITDGSIVGSAGRPGRMLSRPRLLRPPSFSFLEWRWPLIGSASITVLVLFVALRRLGPRQIQWLFITVALAGINLGGAFACFARERPRLLSETWGYAGVGELYFSDGSRHFYEGGLGTPMRVTRIERPNPPSLLQTWWPVIAGPSITILVLFVLWRRVGRQRAGLTKGVDAVSSARPPASFTGPTGPRPTGYDQA